MKPIHEGFLYVFVLTCHTNCTSNTILHESHM